MLFCRPRSRHPLGWRLGNCRHSAGGRPKDRERPGAARSRRGGAHTPFLQTHRFAGPASSGPSSAPPPCGPGPGSPEPRALRRGGPPAPRPVPPGARRASSAPEAAVAAAAAPGRAAQPVGPGGAGQGGGALGRGRSCGREPAPRSPSAGRLARPWRSTSRPFATRRATWSGDTRALRCHHQVFKIEVLMNGRKHFVEKRYSEFHALHKKLKKCIKTPEIPSKHVRNWVPKVLEQRRQGLETYLQAVILENEELPKLFLDFLNVRHLPSLPKAESCGSFDETESEESSKLSHQPVLLFLRDPYVLPAASDFPNVVIEGVLHGIFYPHLQPRYGVCPGHKLPAIPREDVPGSWAPAIRSEEPQPRGYPALLLLEKLTTKRKNFERKG
ncbi:sorting nexin-24 isoform X2 [Felis catus]|nr:sorting nexin-24 isoform X2 [Felis catus]